MSDQRVLMNFRMRISFWIITLLVQLYFLPSEAEAVGNGTGSTSTNSSFSCASCPPWSICKESKCWCLKVDGIYYHCGFNYTTVQTCSCLTYEKESSTFVLGRCVFSCQPNESLVVLPSSRQGFEQQQVCSRYNRTGTMCGACVEGQCPLSFSYKVTCVPCPRSKRNWLVYFSAAFAPTLFLYVILTFFQVDLTKPHLCALVVYSQLWTSPILLQKLLVMFNITLHRDLADKYFTFATSVYGIWSLDFFRAFPHLPLNIGTMQIQALEFLVPIVLLYVMFLILILKELCRYCLKLSQCQKIRCFTTRRDNDNDGQKCMNSLAGQHANIFVLSLPKILSASLNLLLPVRVHALAENHRSHYVPYVDGTVRYFGSEHWIYGILALSITLILVVLPMLVVSLHPFRFFQLILKRFPYTLSTFIEHFAKRFQTYYKDGSEQSKNYRHFASFHLILLVFVHLLYGCLLGPRVCLICGSVLLLAASVFPMTKPYKIDGHSKLFFSFYLLLALQHHVLAIVDNGAWTIKEKVFFWVLLFILTTFPVVFFVGLLILFLWNLVKGYVHLKEPRCPPADTSTLSVEGRGELNTVESF